MHCSLLLVLYSILDVVRTVSIGKDDGSFTAIDAAAERLMKDVLEDNDDDNASTNFCEGMYMAMFMDGFHWSTVWRKGATTPACLNYFVASWKLENADGFHGACFFSLLLAIFLESLTAARSFAIQRLPTKMLPVVSRLVYALQALMGYVLMIITMTFSSELIGSVILGLMIGKYMFSTYEAEEGDETNTLSRNLDSALSIPLTEERRERHDLLSEDPPASLLRRRGKR